MEHSSRPNDPKDAEDNYYGEEDEEIKEPPKPKEIVH
jgi:hypothetical protein